MYNRSMNTYFIAVDGTTIIEAEGDMTEAFEVFYAQVAQLDATGFTGWVTVSIPGKTCAAWHDGRYM